MINERTIETNGVELHLLEAGAEHTGAPLVVLAHGFPELGYSWRHQLPALAAAGYHAVAPDQRGYGRSSRPAAVEDYAIDHLRDDLLGVVDALGRERAVFVGHDWGSMLVWHLAIAAPEHVAGVVGMSVPFLPRPPMPPIQLMRMALGEAFFYVLYFQEPGVADADLGRDPEETLRRMLGGVVPDDLEFDSQALEPDDGRGFVARLPEVDELPDWLSRAELDHYVAEFTRTGFTGGINWYRNFDRNWERTEHLAGAKVEVPSLFVTGSRDPVLLMTPPGVMDGWLTDHRGDVVVDGTGHWVQQEAPAEVNAALLTFLAGL